VNNLNYPIFDRSEMDIRPLSEREHKMSVDDIYQLDSETPPYESENLYPIVEAILQAYHNRKPVIWMMGAHVMRRGNSRLIINLMEEEILTHVATNGAVAIHDFEIALIGSTLEDVERYQLFVDIKTKLGMVNPLDDSFKMVRRGSSFRIEN